VRIQHFRKLNW